MIKEYYQTIDSTNSEASRILDAVSSIPGGFQALNKKLIYSSFQSAGRGRLGRNFFSPETGLYMSLIYCPSVSGGQEFNPALYTAAAAVAVSRAIKTFYGKDSSIKWVNDVYVNGRKVSGILTEGKISPLSGNVEALIVGIGINIKAPEEGFPEEIRDRAGCILEASENCECDIHRLAEFIAEELCRIFDSIKSGDSSVMDEAMTEYRKRSNLIGKKILVTPVISQDEGRYEALVKDITPDAKLKVRLSDGTVKELSSGEVTLHV